MFQPVGAPVVARVTTPAATVRRVPESAHSLRRASGCRERVTGCIGAGAGRSKAKLESAGGAGGRRDAAGSTSAGVMSGCPGRTAPSASGNRSLRWCLYDPRALHELVVLGKRDRGQDPDDDDRDQDLDQGEAGRAPGAACWARSTVSTGKSWPCPPFVRGDATESPGRTTSARSKDGGAEQAAAPWSTRRASADERLSNRFTGSAPASGRSGSARSSRARRNTRAAPLCRPRSCPSAALRWPSAPAQEVEAQIALHGAVAAQRHPPRRRPLATQQRIGRLLVGIAIDVFEHHPALVPVPRVAAAVRGRRRADHDETVALHGLASGQHDAIREPPRLVEQPLLVDVACIGRQADREQQPRDGQGDDQFDKREAARGLVRRGGRHGWLSIRNAPEPPPDRRAGRHRTIV